MMHAELHRRMARVGLERSYEVDNVQNDLF